ncbi:membrane protein [Paramixta manurensis]|uniref:Membrane protein n=1 Tax=Paramixta manurensis TaxID=2740817 RepID=A0A6M8UGG3_9GAMM|nr:membrane protein [Erwiniaceae bacterium PD-1]
MVSALYVVLGALFLLKFTADVVKLRRQFRVAHGDGGFDELRTAIRIHGNATENIPVAALLLVMMEMNGAEVWMLHLTGLAFFLGRAMHFYGMRHSIIIWRRNGMIFTLLALVGMVVLNLIYLPWDLIFTLH